MLSLAVDVARSGLNASGEQASVVSRNIANAGNALASRKIANRVAMAGGGVAIASITRATNDALTRNLQSAISMASGREAVAAALDRLDATVNDPALDSSPAAMLAKLRESLQIAASSPENPTLAATAIDSAKRLASSLNEATDAIQQVRRQADADLQASVIAINEMLARFDAVNREIIKGSRNGADITDQLDARDEIVRSLAEEVGIRTVMRADNDMAIFTDSGLTLFDRQARQVTLVSASAIAPGLSGNSVYIDGLPVTGSGALMAVQSGRISGLTKVRDDYAVTYQRQMDEIARGLIEAFAEKDQSAVPSLPDIPGLFTYAGAPAMPPSGGVLDGLAGAITVNANVDPAAGGDLRLLRDGAIGDPGNVAYTYNTTGARGYSDRLQELIDEIGARRAFDTTTGLASPEDLVSASSASSGWLEDARQKAASDSEYRTTLMERTRDALSKVTGVNLDEEMTSLLDIERAYQISSKLLTVIDSMFDSLIRAT